MIRPLRAGVRGEAGTAVVEFVMISALVMGLLLAVLQVAVYVHVRNVVAASAQEGARYAANADVDSGAGAARTLDLVRSSLGGSTADGLQCGSAEEVDATGLVLVVVECTGAVPALFGALGDLLPVSATGRAIKEGQ
ncbi:MAG: pilus assembly protein [Actinomycetota bacterium]|nr:pilus assembly protein [Actinomycetota bacterium]